jgi:ribosome-associated protein
MIEVTPTIALDEREIELDFVRSSGPGGQKVNKTSTAVQLRFDVRNAASLPEEVRGRLLRLARNRITTEGVLVLDARRHRTQEQNREDALERLVALVRRAAEKPKRRRKTVPTAASRRRRLEAKRRRSEIKRGRGRVGDVDR